MGASFADLEEDFPAHRRRHRLLHDDDGRPQPLGWGAEGLAGHGPERWNGPLFTPLRLQPWRVQVMRGDEYPEGTLTGRVWRAP